MTSTPFKDYFDNLSRVTGKKSSYPGFTLVELLVIISILAILLALAAPSFTDQILGSRLGAAANDFAASTNLARGEAIKRNTPVRLCASSCAATDTSCSCASSGGWQQGWVILPGPTGAAAPIHRHTALPSGLQMTGSTLTITFNPTGVGTTTTTLTLCRYSPSAGSQERTIDVSTTGRASIAKTTTGTCS
jgi:type IV fimbrial biogenesis protein FimT